MYGYLDLICSLGQIHTYMYMCRYNVFMYISKSVHNVRGHASVNC